MVELLSIYKIVAHFLEENRKLQDKMCIFLEKYSILFYGEIRVINIELI